MMLQATLLRPLALQADGLEAFRIAIETQDASGMGPAIEASRFRGQPVAASTGPLYRLENGKAIVSVIGSLVNRGAWTGVRGGLTSYEGIAKQFAAALADPAVSAIVLDIDSPGGEAAGAMEAGAMIRAAASKKPVTAVVNGMAASAGYALASGATRILLGTSSSVGSIGILAMHMDQSQRLAKVGLTPTLIHAGARKAERSSTQPLGPMGRAGLQAEVDHLYGLFVDLVASHRHMPAATVRATEAAMFTGSAAVKARLADAIGSLDDALKGPAASFHSASTVTRMSTSTPQAFPTLDPGRLAAILAMPEAKGLEAEGRAMAQSAMPFDTIRTILGDKQRAAAAERQKAANASWGDVIGGMNAGASVPAAPRTAAAGAWDDVVTSVNRTSGRTP